MGDNYILHLKTNLGMLDIPLTLKDPQDWSGDYFDKGNGGYVYNDCAYYLTVTDGEGNYASISSLFVNNERIEDKDFLEGRKYLYIFLECFGVVRMEVVIGDDSYVSRSIRVAVREEAMNRSVFNMIDYIYDNCDDYLYEEHKNSKTETGVMPDRNISIDTKLALLGEVYDVYIKGYSILRHSAQKKLVDANKVGDFNELKNIRQNTVRYIVNHPEELLPVNYNSGIEVDRRYYQPRKTLVQSVAYSFDIYENQVVVGFLKTVVRDLVEIRLAVEVYKDYNISPYKREGYIDSAYYIYTRNRKMLNEYLGRINEACAKFQKLLIEYKKIFNVTDFPVFVMPRPTSIFRRIMPYNIIFEKILKWFRCGNYDLSKSDLLLSFISVSKIYEYFCLLKMNRSFEKSGYHLVSAFPFKYAENQYYQNTRYNNTFEFLKEDRDVFATVYYQPVIYGKPNGYNKPNGIGLFRNTTVSSRDASGFAISDESEPYRGNYYIPDYLVKISTSNYVNYYILDAKYTHPNNIKRYQLPYLIFKYLFSISTLPKGKNIAGMCILCGKTKGNSTESLYDVADMLHVPVTPNVFICSVTGEDVQDDNDLMGYIRLIEGEVLQM